MQMTMKGYKVNEESTALCRRHHMTVEYPDGRIVKVTHVVDAIPLFLDKELDLDIDFVKGRSILKLEDGNYLLAACNPFHPHFVLTEETKHLCLTSEQLKEEITKTRQFFKTVTPLAIEFPFFVQTCATGIGFLVKDNLQPLNELKKHFLSGTQLLQEPQLFHIKSMDCRYQSIKNGYQRLFIATLEDGRKVQVNWCKDDKSDNISAQLVKVVD